MKSVDEQGAQSSRMVPKDSALPLLMRQPRAFVIEYRLALLVLWAGASADLWTTLLNIEKYGAGIEVHAAQRVLSEIFGIAVGVPLGKLMQLAGVMVVASWWRPWCRIVLATCGVLYGLAAVSNHFLLF